MESIIFEPQAGPQTAFLSSPADIVFYGGAAGGGKTFGLLLDPLRHFHNPAFGCVIFRRNSTQVRNEGGLWDESSKIYPSFGAHPREASLEWKFPAGWKLKFSHLEYDSTVLDWQGGQIGMIGFDEITHFTEKQFWYMQSRNRSTSGIRPYIRATCNPDADSWVAKLIAWWIDQDTGLAIAERSGVIRWFIRKDDEIMWADTSEELVQRFGEGEQPKSFTFIPSKIHDNKILLAKDPGYLANLKALSRVERERLLEGNWKVRAQAGMYFQRGYFDVIDTMPTGAIKTVRYWDRAATKPNETNKDPDWTAGLKLAKFKDGSYVVQDCALLRDAPLAVERLVKAVATQDGRSVRVCIEQDPGSAGVADAGNYSRLLAGYDVRLRKPTKDKVTRALAVSAASEARNIKVLRGPWNDAFFTQLENFPPTSTGHDDIVDGFSGAFNELASAHSILDVL